MGQRDEAEMECGSHSVGAAAGSARASSRVRRFARLYQGTASAVPLKQSSTKRDGWSGCSFSSAAIPEVRLHQRVVGGADACDGCIVLVKNSRSSGEKLW